MGRKSPFTKSSKVKMEQERGWKHRMMCSLRQQSNCWIFGKALRIFPPSMWTIEIRRCTTNVDIILQEDELIKQNNAIYPGGLNLRYNRRKSSVEKLVRYMSTFKETTGIK